MYSTYEEYLRTPEFRAVCGQVAIRSGGTCEVCGEAAATEYHHVQYCKWGDYDVAANLLHICHSCHCDSHRCLSCGQIALKARHIKAGRVLCDRCV